MPKLYELGSDVLRHILSYLPRDKYLQWVSKAFKACAVKDAEPIPLSLCTSSIPMLEWLHSVGGKGEFSSTWLYAHVVHHADMNMVQWVECSIPNSSIPCPELVLEYAVRSGSLECVQWVHRTLTQNVEDEHFHVVIRLGHVHILKWWIDEHACILPVWVSNYHSTYILHNAINCSQWKVVRWVMDTQSGDGHMGLTAWDMNVYHVSTREDMDLVWSLYIQDHINRLVLLLCVHSLDDELGAEYVAAYPTLFTDACTLARVAMLGAHRVLEHLERAHLLDDLDAHAYTVMLKEACEHDQVSILEWVYRMTGRIPQYTTLEHCGLEAIKWIDEKRGTQSDGMHRLLQESMCLVIRRLAKYPEYIFDVEEELLDVSWTQWSSRVAYISFEAVRTMTYMGNSKGVMRACRVFGHLWSSANWMNVVSDACRCRSIEVMDLVLALAPEDHTYIIPTDMCDLSLVKYLHPHPRVRLVYTISYPRDFEVCHWQIMHYANNDKHDDDDNKFT